MRRRSSPVCGVQMTETMTLIAGRTSKQGTSLNAGKLKDEYIEVTTTGTEAQIAELQDQLRWRCPVAATFHLAGTVVNERWTVHSVPA